MIIKNKKRKNYICCNLFFSLHNKTIFGCTNVSLSVVHNSDVSLPPINRQKQQIRDNGCVYLSLHEATW